MPPHVAAGIAGFLGFVAVFLGLGGVAIAASAWLKAPRRPPGPAGRRPDA